LDFHAVSEIVLPPSMFSQGFDAVIMGHIHQHQVMSKDPLVAHIGSMERSDFGEAEDSKYFLIVDTGAGPEPSYEFQPLPVRPLHDITVDETGADPGSGVMADIRKRILDYADGRVLCGSVARAEVIVNDRIVSEVDTAEIMRMLSRELGVYHCAGVFATVVSKRQLRSSEITERLDPKSSFSKWLELEDDSKLRERLRKAGNQIIEESGGKK